MRRILSMVLAAAVALLTGTASASWYSAAYAKSMKYLWPFGETNGVNTAGGPRLSKLMEPASLAIDEASELIADGKTDEAVEKYREALRLLERLEFEYPERAASPEFQSVRNKRAYVDAQLNAILLEEARTNAKAVAVTDTTELEEKLKKKRTDEKARKEAAKADGEKPPKDAAVSGRPKLESELDEYMEDARARAKKIDRAAAKAKFERESEEVIRDLLKKDPESRKARIMRAGLELYRKNYGMARKDLDDLLAKNPQDISALNLLAAVEAATGNQSAAEAALVKAIEANRKDYHAYYNLATLLVKRSHGDDKDRAKRFYKSGRKVGGPEDPKLERILK